MRNSFGQVVETRCEDISRNRILTENLPDPIPDGSVLLHIERFALTANNVTYAALGGPFGYWGFYPAGEEGWGVTPVWGFAVAEASAHPDISVGERFYGFWPFASHALVTPQNVRAHGFADGAPHRQQLHSLYNAVTALKTDPFISGDGEDLVPILRPLFLTAWLLEDYHADEDFFGADILALVSASSKTALSTAFCLKAAGRFKGGLVGITSAGNRGFLEQTGLYDAVVTYDALSALPDGKAALIDFAGNGAVLSAIHDRYGEKLLSSCQVGKSHVDAGPPPRDMPGATPQVFFAPDQAKAVIKRMGPEGFNAALMARWTGFKPLASDWFNLTQVAGLEDARLVFEALVRGDAPGQAAYIVSP